ncbi:hypothetical protein C5708_03610 [Caulobacter sp. CCUG 60055]|nr:hypothetical protein [Caulobacteraceae bacterium]MCI3179333.1 hypothetical protein [Caulobacter sp. CCUG 60055]
MSLAEGLIAQGRPAEAVNLLAPLAAGLTPSHATLVAHASALKGVGRPEAALATNRRAIALYPNSGVAWHNLAATLGDMLQAAEAKAAVEKAFALKLDAPETWLVYARALHYLNDLDGADKAYAQVLKRRPAYFEAAEEHGRLRWMRTGDVEAALRPLDAAARAGGPTALIALAKARLLQAGDRADRRRVVLEDALRRTPGDLLLLIGLAQLALDEGREDEGVVLARQAEARAPSDVSVKVLLTSLLLAQGRAREAFDTIVQAVRLEPANQAACGWLATAARAVGDPAARWLYDYDRFVRPYDIETPEGWPDLDAYLADLATSLRRIHGFSFHPPEQTLRGGGQTMVDLRTLDDPAVQAFFKAIDAPIRAYMAAVGTGREHPLTQKNTGRYRIAGSWSVLLRPNGFHVDHFHPKGWLSSAFYVEVPQAALDGGAREGWIRFGQPPSKITPRQGPEHYVKPKPGRLVLFPSYMWHGTEPFTTEESRLTMAFDVAPA